MNLGKAERFSLKPNLSLINPSFEGYKLKVYSDLDVISFLGNFKGLKQQKKSDVGYLYTKLISLHNHIHPDPYNKLTSYIFDTNYRLHLISLEHINSLSKVVFDLESEGCIEKSEYIVPPSISFPSESLALISNGFSKLSLYETGGRPDDVWEKLLDIDVENSIITYSLIKESSGELHILLISVINPNDLKEDKSLCNLDSVCNNQCLSLHKLQWLTLCTKDNKWTLARKRILVGTSAIELLALTKECDHIVVMSNGPYIFVYDSMKKISQILKEKDIVKCRFKQCSSTITLWVIIENTNLEEIEVDLLSGLEILHSGTSLYKREFSNGINIDSISWKLVKGENKIEVTFNKADEGIWDILFKEDNDRVEEISCLEEHHQENVNVVMENTISDPESEKPPYNSGELEDCDETGEEITLFFLDGDLYTCSRFSVLNNARPLFTHIYNAPSEPGFCLRHDVDGLFWKLDGNQVPIHSATFNAFGYVRASKSMAKYTAVPSDNSYVAISDVKSHLYVFYQSRTVEGELRNRRSGALVPTFAQQLVISLKNRDEVMGIYAVKEGILVLNHDKITFYSLPNNC